METLREELERMEQTWDGLPISREKPYGVAVIVWREGEPEREWLVLHRKHNGYDYAGDWAWTPPSGARQPGETPDGCALRELLEETGLDIPFTPTSLGSEEWAVYRAEAPPDAQVVLDPEHDRYAWLPLDEAAALCRPESVADSLRAVARSLDRLDG